jgi:hypothetical protein
VPAPQRKAPGAGPRYDAPGACCTPIARRGGRVAASHRPGAGGLPAGTGQGPQRVWAARLAAWSLRVVACVANGTVVEDEDEEQVFKDVDEPDAGGPSAAS